MTVDLRTLHNTPWLAEPAGLRRAVARVVAFKTCPTSRQMVKRRRQERELAASLPAMALDSTGVDDAVETQLASGGNKAIRSVKGKVGVIPIHGPIGHHMTAELDKAGGTSCDFIGLALDAMMDSPNIDAVVLHVDSPGGYSFGVQEIASRLYDARGKKPLYAIADASACSAAFWIATAASQFFCTPSGEVGSVGVYAVHVDESVANDMQGLSFTLVKAGKYKAELAPLGPLTDEAKANLQEQVDDDYAAFIDALKRNRGVSADTVRDTYGQGRSMGAKKALAAGMIDRILTFQELMQKLTGTTGSGTAGVATKSIDAAILRMRHEHRKRQMAFLGIGQRP